MPSFYVLDVVLSLKPREKEGFDVARRYYENGTSMGGSVV